MYNNIEQKYIVSPGGSQFRYLFSYGYIIFQYGRRLVVNFYFIAQNYRSSLLSFIISTAIIMKVSISSRAYSKILLHASKYPHKAVCGVVIAHENSDNKIEVLDAVPLFHLSLGLAPMMEVALTQV